MFEAAGPDRRRWPCKPHAPSGRTGRRRRYHRAEGKYIRDRRLLLGTPELRSGVLGNRYTLELAQKIDVPIVASQLTIRNRMQSNRFLPRDEGEDGFILYTSEFLGSEISFFHSGARRRQCVGAQKTAHVIRSKGGLHLRLLE